MCCREKDVGLLPEGVSLSLQPSSARHHSTLLLHQRLSPKSLWAKRLLNQHPLLKKQKWKHMVMQNHSMLLPRMITPPRTITPPQVITPTQKIRMPPLLLHTVIPRTPTNQRHQKVKKLIRMQQAIPRKPTRISSKEKFLLLLQPRAVDSFGLESFSCSWPSQSLFLLE